MSNPKNYALKALFVVLVLITAVSAQTPRLINYQGLVVTSTGEPVTDGFHNFNFKIYNASTGGTQLWFETGISIVTTDGLFTRELGNVTPFSPNLFVNKDSSLYLEVTVDGQIQLPRTRLICVPFAETAGNLNGQSPYTGGTIYRTYPFEARFSTFGGDGLEQIRLWGEDWGELFLFNGRTSNGLTAILSASEDNGGQLFLNDSVGNQVITLDAGIIGNDAVELPAGAISPDEMLAEPGVANDIGTTFFVNLDSPMVDYKIDSVTITIPSSGYVELTGGCYVNTAHVEGFGTDVFVGISKTQNIDYFVPGCVVVGISNARPTGNERVPAFSTRLYGESAGTHIYYLVAERNSGGTNNTNIANPSIVAKFFPTAYGPIATTSFDNESELPHLQGVSPDGSQAFENPYVRIQSLEKINAQLSADLEAAKREAERLLGTGVKNLSESQQKKGRQNR